MPFENCQYVKVRQRVKSLTDREGVLLHELNRALTNLNAVLEKYPNYSLALVERGKVYIQQKKLDLALGDLNRTLNHSPGNVQILSRMGMFITCKINPNWPGLI